MICFTYAVPSDSEHNDQSDVAKSNLATFDTLEVHAQKKSADGGDALKLIEEFAAIHRIASSMRRPLYN